MSSKFFDEIDSKLPNYLEVFANKSLDIIEQIHAILEHKGLTQKDLARSLGKSESEISKWLSGGHNLTLKTISKLEDVLGEEIIITPKRVLEQFEILPFEKKYSLDKIGALEELDNCEFHGHSKTDLSRFKPLVNC